MDKALYTTSVMTSEAENNDMESNSDVTASDQATAQKPGRHPMEFLLKNAGNFALPRVGELVEGEVIEKKGARLFVDLDGRGVGIVYGREFSIAQDLIKNLNAGDRVSAKIVDADNEEGYVELSLKEAGEEKRWVDFKKMMRDGEAVELPVLEANRGGLILEIKGVKGFLPASQLSSKNYPRVDGGDKEKIYLELQKLVGVPLKVKILDLDPGENKVIFTEKETDRENIRAALANFKVGDEVEGEITGVVDFGAFMRIGNEPNLEGLIHISEIDWILIENPREVLKPGDRVKAKIIDIQGDKISLSLKALKEDPWVKIAEKYQKGDMVKGKITKFNPFGAFVELGELARPVRSSGSEGADAEGSDIKEDHPAGAKSKKTSNGVQGLVHISEFGTEVKMRETLELGKEYDFKVLLIEPKEHRMSLGIVREKKEEVDVAPAIEAA